jgi:bifunctional lysine-specific demethylase and histidyl-hydroxylase MINA
VKLTSCRHVFFQVESICEFVDSRTTKHPEKDTEANKISYLIIDTVVLLVSSRKVDKMQSMQQELVRSTLSLLYKVWKKVKLLRSSADCNNRKNQLQSREYEISKAIFNLSIELASPACLEPDVVRKSIFGQAESNFENFVLAYWEKSPNLYRRKQNTQNDDPVFAALNSAFNLGTTPDAIIESFIKGLVSCPAIASDELDINSFLHEVHDSLGDAIKYRQDIRVLRTEDPSDQTSRVYAREEHFFDDGTVFLDEEAFAKKCKHAFKKGYSVALRGLEFRSEKVAAIASALADLFGQPSVGANIYFSPPRSQGLARHYDDHCVLVWQLLGCKKWMIWPNPKPLLPRLYEPFDPLDCTLDDNSGRVEVLHEGDMMYIPRGYVHEAHTDVGESQMNAYAGYSLHLTLAIEVEPPFE